MKKKFKVEHNWVEEFNSIWEIDVNPKTQDMLEEFMSFHMGDRDLLKFTDDDIYKAALLKLSATAADLAVSHNYNLNGVITTIAELEGYPKVDGSQGITLLSPPCYLIEARDFEVHPVK